MKNLYLCVLKLKHAIELLQKTVPDACFNKAYSKC